MPRFSLLMASVGLAGSACSLDAADPEIEATVAAVTCTGYACEPTISTPVASYRMFDETSFTPIVDGWGRTRQFYVHIPARYDTLTSSEQMPVIFAFHGGDQDREAMIDDVWADYFEQDYAFVIPRGEADPCDGMKRQWIEPTVSERSTPTAANCSAATLVFAPGGKPLTYRTSAMAEAFTDVQFAEDLRAAVLARFPKLNPGKVYATGFSAGGGMTLTLACYRSGLFRGFSAVGKTLDSPFVRGDYDRDLLYEIDPLSMPATCGRNDLDLAHATGITSPHLWGTGRIQLPSPTGTTIIVPFTIAKPVALFLGDNDSPGPEIDNTTAFVRERNNLGTGYTFVNNYQNLVGTDAATTQRRTYTGAADPTFSSAALRRFRVSAPTDPDQAAHAIPDLDHCAPSAGRVIMTCDYNFTTETLAFFQTQADLSLVP